jgi:putative PIG3 family NAD(P)H quinone oxidoreductase
MKAVRIARPGGPKVLEVSSVATPAPGAGEVLVEIRAAGVNRADLLQRMGSYPPPSDAPADIPGLEYAGIVSETGEAVEDILPGERVMGLLGGGGYAERAVVPADQVIPIPGEMSFVHAAGVPEVFITAYDALRTLGGLRAGEDVLVHAAGGGVGTAALQLARTLDAARIFGTASGPKLEAIAAAELPLDVGIDYRTRSFRDVVSMETGGRGIDVILDTVGADYWSDNLDSLATCGRLVVVGLLGGAQTTVDLGRLMRGRLTVVGTVLRARSAAEKAALAAEFRQDLLPLFEAGTLRPVLDRVFPLEAAAEAHEYLEANESFGNVVLEVGAM